MDESRIFGAVLATACAVYFGYLLRQGLKTGALEPPGAGQPLRRDKWPGVFRLSLVLYGMTIMIMLAVAVMAVFGIHQ